MNVVDSMARLAMIAHNGANRDGCQVNEKNHKPKTRKEETNDPTGIA